MPDILTHTNGQLKEQEQEILYRSRSEEVQEIMGRVPSWITRWGISLMALLFIGLMIGAALFKYPDIIPARVIVSSGNPPVKIIARNSLPIQQLYIENNSPVKKQQVLCILSNPGNYDDIIVVNNLARQIDSTIDLRRFALNFEPGTQNLGDLQNDYIILMQAIMNYRFFLEHNGYKIKIGHLTEQSGFQSKLSKQLANNDARIKEQLDIQEHRFKLDSSLVAETIMSKVEYETARKELLGQQINTEANNTTMLQSKLQEKEIQKNISEATIQFQTDENNHVQKIRDAAKTFNGSLEKWEQNYVLRSPVDGKVVFFKYWKENQFVEAGETVMMVTPPIRNYLARGNISVIGAGKAKPGQKVLIKLLSYPFEEYGSLRGVMKSKSSVTMDTTFAIEITLLNGLHTNAEKQIPDQPQIEGIAEITTESRSLLQRLFENIYGKQRR